MSRSLFLGASSRSLPTLTWGALRNSARQGGQTPSGPTPTLNDQLNDDSPATLVPALTGLECALCALASFRHRHLWRERGSRKGVLVRNRIKDLSRSGVNRQACKMWIADARRAGFRGSIIAQVTGQNSAQLGKETH